MDGKTKISAVHRSFIAAAGLFIISLAFLLSQSTAAEEKRGAGHGVTLSYDLKNEKLIIANASGRTLFFKGLCHYKNKSENREWKTSFGWSRIQWYDGLNRKWEMDSTLLDPELLAGENSNLQTRILNNMARAIDFPITLFGAATPMHSRLARIGVVLPDENGGEGETVWTKPFSTTTTIDVLADINVTYDKKQGKLIIHNSGKKPFILPGPCYQEITWENGKREVAFVWSRIQWYEPKLERWVMQGRFRNRAFGGTTMTFLDTHILPGASEEYRLPFRLIREVVPEDAELIRIGVDIRRDSWNYVLGAERVIWSKPIKLEVVFKLNYRKLSESSAPNYALIKLQRMDF